jgi:uncharacterized RDD family membrane protein YckC
MAPPVPSSPESPAGPQSPSPPGYGGPVPPGGWQQPMPQGGGAGGFAPGPLASWGSRLGAHVLDNLIVLVPFVIIFGVIAAAFGIVGGDADDDLALGGLIAASLLGVVLYAAIYLLYAPLLMRREGAHNGQTWGKQALGIRVVRDSGEAFTFWPAAVREVVLKGLAVGIASSIIPILPWFLNFFWPLWDDQNRALHDMAVSTHVVRT